MSQVFAPRVAITVLLLVSTLLAGVLSDHRQSDLLVVPLKTIDSNIIGWQALHDDELDAHVLRRLDPTSYLSRTYQRGADRLGLFIAFYAQQRAGEAMHSPKHCLPGAGWEIWKHGSVRVPVHGSQVEINKYSIANSGQRMTMLYWYQSKERVVASEYMVKTLLIKDSLLSGHTSGSIVRITLADNPESSEVGVAFASRLIDQVQRCFGR